MAETPAQRKAHAHDVRHQAAHIADGEPLPNHVNNGDEYSQRDFIAAFSKGLPHNTLGPPRPGEVLPSAYQKLLDAVHSDDPEDWEKVPLAVPPIMPPPPLGAGPARKLKNPQAGLAYDLQGPDVAALKVPPAPAFDSARMAAEMAEVYWMALLRDLPFINYGTAEGATDAATSLNMFGGFTEPPDALGNVTLETLFRGQLPGDKDGPYISQFLLRGVTAPYLGLTPGDGIVTFGNLRIDQRQDTAQAGTDFLKDFASWLDSQNRAALATPIPHDPTRRFIRNGRDLAHRVRPDRAYQHYLIAALILMSLDPFTPTVPDRSPMEGTDPGNPYGSHSNTQEGFATFGDWHILTLLAEVTTRALQAAWYQKWFVHRRLRPEEFAGRIHQWITDGMEDLEYTIHKDILETADPGNPEGLLRRIFAFNSGPGNGTYLLPQAYPEGAPLHPSYPSGHAVLAGACVTILKAHFDETLEFGPSGKDSSGRQRLGEVFEPDAEGENLVPAGGVLTVGRELNKLASNIALGRNFAGVHYRSDYLEGVKLGEKVAIKLLQEQTLRYHENGLEAEPPFYTLTRFDEQKIRIKRGAVEL